MSTDTRLHEDHTAEVRASIVVAGVVAFVASVVANLVIRFLGMQIADIPEGFDPLASALPTIIVTGIATALAVLVYALVLRFSSSPRRTFVTIAAIAFLISLAPLLGVRANDDEATTAAIIILGLMHIASALIIVPTLLRLGR